MTTEPTRPGTYINALGIVALIDDVDSDNINLDQRIALAQVYATLAVADAIERTARQPAPVEPVERVPPPCPEHQIPLVKVGGGRLVCPAAGCLTWCLPDGP